MSSAALSDVDFDVSPAISDLDGVIAHLGEINDLVEEETEAIKQDAKSRARWGKTGRYREAIRSKIFRYGQSVEGKVFVIQGDWVRDLSKLWPANLPLWLEYGTAKMAARPHLIPAFQAGIRRLNAAVERLLSGVAS